MLYISQSRVLQLIILIWQGKREKCSNFYRLNRQDGAVRLQDIEDLEIIHQKKIWEIDRHNTMTLTQQQ